MQNYIRKRAVKIAQYILQTSSTVRQAEVFGISKSTVHKDVAERLPRIDEQLAEQVKRFWTRTRPKGTSVARGYPAEIRLHAYKQLIV